MEADQRFKASQKQVENLKTALDEHATVAIIDPTGKITYVNDKFCAISKYSREELLTEDHPIINSQHHPKEFIDNLWATIAADKVWKGEIKNRAKGGSLYWVDTTIVPFVNEDGQLEEFVAIGTDITQRTGAIITSSRLSAIVEFSDDAIIGKDLESIITSWNKGAETLFGYSASEILGTSIMRLIPADRQHEESQILEKIKGHESVRHFETLRRKKDGSTIAVSVTASPIKSADGKVIGVSKVARDITDRRQAEAVLRQERDWAKVYLDTAEVILLGLDLNGRITLVNRYACSVLGWIADELLGRDWIETCLPARIRNDLKERFQNVLREEVSTGEYPLLTSSGEERLIEWRTRLLRDDTGTVIGTFTSGTDITERNRAVEALRTAEERLRFALEAAGVGIWDMNCTTGKLYWSRLLESQYGLESGAFAGTFNTFIECVHPDDRERTLETIGNAMKSGTDFSTLNRVNLPNGTLRWLRGAGRIQHGDDGEPVRGVGISQDVTESKNAEAEFKRLNEEIHLQRTRVFKATMRTVQDIVNNFLNSLQFVHFEAEGQQPPEAQTLINELIHETAMKLRMLGDLHTISEKEMAIGTCIDYPGAAS